MNKLFKGLLGLVVGSSLYLTNSSSVSFAQETKNQEKLPDFQIMGYKTQVLSPVGDYCPVMLRLLIRNNGDADAELPLVKVKGKSPSGKDLDFNLGYENEWCIYNSDSWISERYQHTSMYEGKILGQKKSVFVQREIGLLKEDQIYTTEFSAVVDPENQIIESDEDNNKLKFNVAIHYKEPEAPVMRLPWRQEERQVKPAQVAKPIIPSISIPIPGVEPIPSITIPTPSAEPTKAIPPRPKTSKD